MKNQDLEPKLWQVADKLRNNMDAAEYKHVVLGLIFLKYISDSFENLYNILKKDPIRERWKERDGLGDDESKKRDILGRVYEYFIGQFASAEGKMNRLTSELAKQFEEEKKLDEEIKKNLDKIRFKVRWIRRNYWN